MELNGYSYKDLYKLVFGMCIRIKIFKKNLGLWLRIDVIFLKMFVRFVLICKLYFDIWMFKIRYVCYKDVGVCEFFNIYSCGCYDWIL